MPETAPEAKVAATKGYGAEVRQAGHTFDDAYKKCMEDLKKEKDLIFISPRMIWMSSLVKEQSV